MTVLASRLKAPPETWQWYGNAAHFISGARCQFHLATRVGPWLVSTVGEMPQNPRDPLRRDGSEWEEIGYHRTYETMVFRADKDCSDAECGCGMPTPTSMSELDMRGYKTRREATEGHYAFCWKWAAVGADEVSSPDKTTDTQLSKPR